MKSARSDRFVHVSFPVPSCLVYGGSLALLDEAFDGVLGVVGLFWLHLEAEMKLRQVWRTSPQFM